MLINHENSSCDTNLDSTGNKIVTSEICHKIVDRLMADDEFKGSLVNSIREALVEVVNKIQAPRSTGAEPVPDEAIKLALHDHEVVRSLTGLICFSSIAYADVMRLSEDDLFPQALEDEFQICVKEKNPHQEAQIKMANEVRSAPTPHQI
jgi:hypothetical protein